MATINAKTVAEAAERILADGNNPTQSAVRAALGGGSYSTIAPLLQEWREKREEAAELAEVDLPDAIANAGSDLLARVWKIAMAEALAGHDALRKELLQAQADAEAAQQETAEVAASLEADLSVRDERIVALEAQMSVQAGELKGVNDRAIIAERDLAGARERAEAETARADRSEKQLEDMAATVKKFESEVTSLRDRLEATTASLSEQKSETVRLTSERDHAQKMLVSAETRLERAEAKIEKLQSTLDSTQADLLTARSDLATARAERGQA